MCACEIGERKSVVRGSWGQARGSARKTSARKLLIAELRNNEDTVQKSQTCDIAMAIICRRLPRPQR